MIDEKTLAEWEIHAERGAEWGAAGATQILQLIAEIRRLKAEVTDAHLQGLTSVSDVGKSATALLDHAISVTGYNDATSVFEVVNRAVTEMRRLRDDAAKWKGEVDIQDAEIAPMHKALQRIRSLDPKNAGEAIEIAREVLG